MKIQCTMAVLPKDNVKVSVSGNYLQVAYDFVRIEQKEEDASESMQVVIQTCYRRKITFSEPQDLSHSISVRRFGKSVSALKAACGLEDIGSV